MANYYISPERLKQYDTLLKAYVAESIVKNAYDDTALASQVSTNTSAIELLNGDETTVGSVLKTVADQIAVIISDAPESFDTLKEISDWISSHEDSAASMNSAIQTNTTNISTLSSSIDDLTAYIGTLPSEVNVTDIVSYIAYVYGALTDYITSNDTALAELATLVGTLPSSASSTTLVDYVKEYADSLASNYATAAQGAKADSAVQTIETGTTNGTISVDGTDVKVAGLGELAFLDDVDGGSF